GYLGGLWAWARLFRPVTELARRGAQRGAEWFAEAQLSGTVVVVRSGAGEVDGAAAAKAVTHRLASTSASDALASWKVPCPGLATTAGTPPPPRVAGRAALRGPGVVSVRAVAQSGLQQVELREYFACDVGEPLETVGDLLTDQVVAVGHACGKRQSQRPDEHVTPSPRVPAACGALTGQRLGDVHKGHVTVADARRVGLAQGTRKVQQSQLPGWSRRQNPCVVVHRSRADALQPWRDSGSRRLCGGVAKWPGLLARNCGEHQAE